MTDAETIARAAPAAAPARALEPTYEGDFVLPKHLELESGRMVCSCEACGVLFEHRGQGRYRRIGRTVRYLENFTLTDAEWDSFRIPIGLAFFVRTEDGARAYYPGPAGCTESRLPVAESFLPQMEPRVEALLVNRVGGAREHFVAPIDRCYQLAGLIRRYWRGFSGGEEVWREIGDFFGALREAGRA